jgi:zinc/manganese transport system substrate-binding protein
METKIFSTSTFRVYLFKNHSMGGGNILKNIILISLIVLLLVSVSACQAGPAATSDGKKSIVVTYSILGSVVKDLAGDKAAVTVSIPNGQDPHDWEPSAKDIENINKADMVIRNGLGLESGLEKTLQLAKNNGVTLFTATDHITIRYVGEGEGIPTGDPDQALGAADPHLWTDPLAIKSFVSALALAMKNDLDIDVSSRAADLEDRLDALNKQVSDLVAAVPETDRKLVTGHESMGYFAQRYGFKLVGVIIPSLTSQAGVSAADLSGLKKIIQDSQVKAVFTELGTSPAAAEAIGKETGVKVVELTTHALPEDETYFSFMLNLSRVIVDGLK